MGSRQPTLGAVVDTNVVAYYLLRTEPFAEEAARTFRLAGELLAPASWEPELANVIWQAVRAGVILRDEARRRLRLAARLGLVSVSVQGLWEGALVRALDGDHPAYDTLFVELAVRSGVPLVTFDGALLRKFPDVACRPGSLTFS